MIGLMQTLGVSVPVLFIVSLKFVAEIQLRNDNSQSQRDPIK